jgi:undecaprenyl-diphosphatase
VLVLAALAGSAAALGAVVHFAARRWPRSGPIEPTGEAIEHEIEAESDRHPKLEHYLAERSHPRRLTGVALTAAAVVFAAGAVAVGVLLILVRTRTGFDRLDLRPARWASRNATDVSTDVLRFVTNAGASWFLIALGAIVALVEHRRLPHRAVAGFLALVIGGQLIVTNTIKWLVERARPDIDPLSDASGTSFPSGHTAAAAAGYAALALVIGVGHSPETRARLAGAAGAVAGMVAASRVLLGVHWITDVLAGIALGWAWFALCSMAFGGRVLHFGAPVERAVEHAVEHQAEAPTPERP